MKNYYLIYYDIDGSSEDSSVFYCELVLATNKRNALVNYFKHFDIHPDDQYQFGVERKKLIDLT